MEAYDGESSVLSDAIQNQIKLNGQLHEKIAENDDKYDKFLQELQEIRNCKDDNEADKLSTKERMDQLEIVVKKAAVERKILSFRLNDSTAQLEKLLCVFNENKQYLMRENLLIKGLKNVPTWLKGYKFSMWVAHVLNCLIPNLDFIIQPQHISVSHPLYKCDDGTTVVIARFAIRDVRNEIFYKKQYITNHNITITEHLTKSNQDLLKAATDLVGPKNAWTSQTNVFGKVGAKVTRIKTPEDIEKLKLMKLSSVPTPPPLMSGPSISSVTPPTTADSSIKLSTESVSEVAINKDSPIVNDVSLLMESYPSLSQADLITAIRDFEDKRSKRGREKGHHDHRGRENYGSNNGRGNSRAPFRSRGRTYFRPFY